MLRKYHEVLPSRDSEIIDIFLFSTKTYTCILVLVGHALEKASYKYPQHIFMTK